MKRIWIIILTCLLLICCTSCTSSNLEKKYHAHRDESEILKIVDNETPYDKLITQEYDIHEIMEKYIMDGYFSSGAPTMTMEDWDILLRIECLRQNEADNYYAVYKIKQGGLLYVFFETMVNEINLPQKYIKDWYYVKKPLSYADFASIKEGSSWKDVKKIDPVTQIFKNMRDTNEKVSLGVTWHYLTDGILALYYDDEHFRETGESIVSELVYWDDYTAEMYTPSLAQPPYDARVLDIDMLKK